MNHLELQQTFLDNYKIGACYCRNAFEKGGACIFVQENVRYVKLDLEKHCKDKDFEVCAKKMYFNTRHAYIIAIHRAPSGNFDFFITKLHTILRRLHTVNTEFIICGDINIDYLTDSNRKSRLEVLLKTYEGWNFNSGNYYLQLIQNRYMFRSFTVLQCSHQHCVQPVAIDVEVVGYL